MTHVSIQGFGTRNRQDDRAKRQKSQHRIRDKKLESIRGRQCQKYVGPLHQIDDAKDSKHEKIQQHYRTEKLADRFGPA